MSNIKIGGIHLISRSDYMSRTSNKRKSSTGLTREEYVEKMRRRKLDDNEPRIKRQANRKNDKNKKKNNKKTNSPKKKIIKIILIVILIIIIVMLIRAIISMVSFNQMAKEMIQNLPSTIVDSTGNEITKVGEERNRENISFDEMPENLKDAYVAIEDQRFYSHFGIDIRRTGAATIDYITSFANA